MTLIPENQRIVDEQGLISWGQYPERFALAIQTATAKRCAEIAGEAYRDCENLNEKHYEGASVELNCSASTASEILRHIREEFGLEKP